MILRRGVDTWTPHSAIRFELAGERIGRIVDSRSIQDTMEFVSSRLNITKDQAMAQISQSTFLKVPATVQDTANAAVLLASDHARMLTGTVVNATAGAALD